MSNGTFKNNDVLMDTAASRNIEEVSKADIDLSLLEESLRLTPWERMLANDDALNLAESLRTAVEKRHAEP